MLVLYAILMHPEYDDVLKAYVLLRHNHKNSTFRGIMKVFFLFNFICLLLNSLSAAEFTISSYNCGGLSDHYDYLRAVSMEKVMQGRYLAEPEAMSQNEKIQRLALKILFAKEKKEETEAREEWKNKHCRALVRKLMADPTAKNSPNAIWHKKAEEAITSYKVRPVVIHDKKVNQTLGGHLRGLTGRFDAKVKNADLLQEARHMMAKKIFDLHVNHDIIALQEANYLDPSVFPSHYEVLFSNGGHLKTGIAWNKHKFELIEQIEEPSEKALVLLLRAKESEKTVLVASAHLTGCNPFGVLKNPTTGQADSAKGDAELQAIVALFEVQEADVKVIAMDSNVTSLHPRLKILKKGKFMLDYDNFIDPTCANPYQVLNTRIDWIAFKCKSSEGQIANIPVLSVGLNNHQTNMSDHAPIAAKIRY